MSGASEENHKGPGSFEFEISEIPVPGEVSEEISSSGARIAWQSLSAEEIRNKNLVSGLAAQGIQYVPLITGSEENSSDLRNLQDELSRAGVDSDVYRFPGTRQIDESLVEQIPDVSLKTRFKNLLRSPTNEQFALGIISGVWRAVGSGLVYLPMAYISHSMTPGRAAAIALAMGLSGFIHVAYVDRFDRLFSGSNGKRRFSKKTEFLNRQAYTAAYEHLWRGLSGPVGQTRAVMTTLGELQIGIHTLFLGGGGSLFSTFRHRHLSERASTWINFNQFLLTSVLGLMSTAGLHFGTVEAVPFLNGTVLSMLGSYLGFTLWIKKNPASVERAAAKQDRFFKKVVMPKFEKTLRPLRLRPSPSICEILF